MSKYANLPDIDTAPDVYESPDVLVPVERAESSDDESSATPSRIRNQKDQVFRATREELDPSGIQITKATNRFKRAERKERIPRSVFAFPPSPTSPTSAPPRPLSHRLNALRGEIDSLESEISDPSNPLLQTDEINPGELMRGLLDVRARLEKIGNQKEGRGRLVELVVSENQTPRTPTAKAATAASPKSRVVRDDAGMAEMDRRVKELEALLGSSAATLDDATPIPPPLLTTVQKLNNQMGVLTQPRHIEAISRRLKLLLADLDRHAASQNATSGTSGKKQAKDEPAEVKEPTLSLQEQMAPVLSRLSSQLPQLPHILARLRTLSALHSSAAIFDETLTVLEGEQQQVRKTLDELSGAVEVVEQRLHENESVVKGNVSDLERRVEDIAGRLRRLED